MDPKTELEKGVELLKATMQSAGFHFVFESCGNSSGGNFAQGAFISGNKRLQLSFRWSLGCVEYQVSNYTLSHTEYMEAIGKKREASYPGFSNQPIESFKHLESLLSHRFLNSKNCLHSTSCGSGGLNRSIKLRRSNRFS